MALDTEVRMPWLEQPNPGDFMLASAQAAQGIGRNFAAAFSEAQEQKRRENVLEKLKPVATAFAATSTPSETLALVQQNPEWMADPDIQPLTSQWLQFQATKQKIVDQTVEGQLAIRNREDIVDLRQNWGLENTADQSQVKASRIVRARNQYQELANKMGISDPLPTMFPPLLPDGNLNVAEAQRKLGGLRAKVPEGMTPSSMTVKTGTGATVTYKPPVVTPEIPAGLEPSRMTVKTPTGTQTFSKPTVPKTGKAPQNPYEDDLMRAEADFAAAQQSGMPDKVKEAAAKLGVVRKAFETKQAAIKPFTGQVVRQDGVDYRFDGKEWIEVK